MNRATQRSSSPAALFACAASGIGIYGVAFALLGTILAQPEMHARLQMNTAQQGTLFLTLYAGVFLSNALIGPLLEAWGSKLVLVSSALFVAVSLLWFALLQTICFASCAALLLGFGGGCLNVGANALVSDAYPGRRGSMLNLLGVFFGVGALSVPLGAATLLRGMGISHLLLATAALPLISAMLYTLLSFPEPKPTRGRHFLQSVRVLRYPGVIPVGLLLFFENANEAVIAAWTAIYASALGCKPYTATLILGCYWASIMLGRLAAWRMIQRLPRHTILVGGAGGTIAGCCLMLVASSPRTLVLAAVVTGVSLAPIFKTALSIASDRHPQATGSIFGVVFSMSLLGAMGAPWLVGQIAHRYSIHMGPFVPIGGAVCVILMAHLIERSATQDVVPGTASLLQATPD